MSKIFKELTSYIPDLQEAPYGEWIVDRENDGSKEHPISMPYVDYSGVIRRFVKTVYSFCDAHPEFDHVEYQQTLNDFGVEWGTESMSKADVSKMDAKGVIALLVGAIRADRFCEGALLEFFERGCILRWLNRLAEFDF